jgi:uncharacterized protein (DUF58 family)
MRTDPDVQSAVNSFRLLMPAVRTSGRTGNLLGRGAGSSLEFQEYREYLPGDDVRHLDWAAYARSDALMVRLYREEISPQVEVLLDASRSMTTNPTKSQTARQLAAAFVLWSSQLGGGGGVSVLDDANIPVRLTVGDLERLGAIPFDGRSSPAESVHRLTLRRQAVRVLISDFLFDADPEPLIRKCAAGAGALWVLQLLSRWESSPTELGGRRLSDVETGAEADVVLNPAAIAAYSQRLKSLQETLRESCRRVRAVFLVLISDDGLRELCRRDLCAARLLEPA